MKTKRGQVTLFIIMALILIGIISSYFFFRKITKPSLIESAEENPEAYMQLCVEDELKDIINLITLQGGFYDPKDYVLVDDNEKATYLCKNTMNFKPCINQHPMLISEVENEIKEQATPIINKCFSELKKDFEEKGMGVELSPESSEKINVDIAIDKILINVQRKISINKKEEINRFDEINLKLKSSLYDLIHVSARIVNNEAKFCYFEKNGYMNMHPEYLILLNTLSDTTKIYTISKVDNSEKMHIAVRGCVIT